MRISNNGKAVLVALFTALLSATTLSAMAQEKWKVVQRGFDAQGNAEVVLLDVDTKEGKELAPGFTEVGFENAIPYFCILDKNGKVVKALTGGTSAEQFLKFLSSAFK